MHFAIPTTTEFVHQTNKRIRFTGFNIHINGVFHACLRFKQIFSLHEQLKRSLPNIMLPPFPSKKLFSLGAIQLEERRASLERYIQLIGQDPIFSKSEILRSFLLAAQQESAAVEAGEVTFDVHLMNGHRIAVKCCSTDCSSKVLEKACTALDLPRELTYYFSLFLLRKDERGDVVITRKLMDFEAPYITQRNSGDAQQCVLRKSYWDPVYDLEVMKDPVGLNLLYIQTVSDDRWLVASAPTREVLAGLQARGKKREYMDIARNLPNYGSIHFTGCSVDYPSKTTATVIIGNREINFQTQANPDTLNEMKFRVTRIRCWKITIHNPEEVQPTLELSFEFLMSKNYLNWIHISSEKAMMMAVCLQSLVSELLNQKSDTNNLKVASNVIKSNARVSFLKRDETNQFKPLRSTGPSVTSPTSQEVANQDASAEVIAADRNGERQDGQQEERSRALSRSTVKQKLKEISTTVFFKNGQNRVHNEAFEGIGDDDL